MRRLSSDERGLVGGGNILRSPAPARTPFTGVGLPVIVFPPAGECWPELADLWRALLR